jgi:hypothetical protein
VLPRSASFLLIALAAVVLAACGGDDGGGSSSTGTATSASIATRPALARTPAKAGELVFSEEASPASHGPFSLDGRYVVRFEQFAPEDPKLDFSGQTPFTANLRPAGSRGAGAKLFGVASASGRRELERHGRFVLDVSFGDFPYAVRFTPRR